MYLIGNLVEMVSGHHSLIRNICIENNLRNIVEIGVAWGTHTFLLSKLVQKMNGYLVSIDPKPALNIIKRLRIKFNRRILFIQSASLKALSYFVKNGKKFDCFIIDGDHNYYTVYHELKLISEGLLTLNGVIFFHDTEWPYARRDLYYNPPSVPKEFRHPFRKWGIVKGQSELTPHGGFNSEFYNAIHEGGERNGVLTAIEDFVHDNPSWTFELLTQENFGLGVVKRKKGRTTK
jgi:predicted O-methyltransferase YrrM